VLGTLTIAPGVEVLSDGNPSYLQCTGTGQEPLLSAKGTAGSPVRLTGVAISADCGHTVFDYVHARGGFVLGAHAIATHSVFEGLVGGPGTMADVCITDSVFIDAPRLRLLFTCQAERMRFDFRGDGLLMQVPSLAPPKNCVFENPGRPVVELIASGDYTADMDLTGNYWGTTVPGEIAAMIIDKEEQPDFLNRALYEPFLEVPSPDVPTREQLLGE
jgi:hypothetical protein